MLTTWYVTRWSVGGRRPATETPATEVEEPANFSLGDSQWKWQKESERQWQCLWQWQWQKESECQTTDIDVEDYFSRSVPDLGNQNFPEYFGISVAFFQFLIFWPNSDKNHFFCKLIQFFDKFFAIPDIVRHPPEINAYNWEKGRCHARGQTHTQTFESREVFCESEIWNFSANSSLAFWLCIHGRIFATECFQRSAITHSRIWKVIVTPQLQRSL